MNNARTFLLLTRKYPFEDLDKALRENVSLFVRNMPLRQEVSQMIRTITSPLYDDIEDHAIIKIQHIEPIPYFLSDTGETNEQD